jgi:hypothetical protein
VLYDHISYFRCQLSQIRTKIQVNFHFERQSVHFVKPTFRPYLHFFSTPKFKPVISLLKSQKLAITEMSQQVLLKAFYNMINKIDMCQYFYMSYHNRNTEGDKLQHICQLQFLPVERGRQSWLLPVRTLDCD